MLRTELIFGLMSISAFAQTPKVAPFDPRLPANTIVREDIFAGYDGNMERLARGETNLEALLVERPQAKATLMAWKGSIALTRAVYANEAGRSAEFEQQYRKALEFFAEALRLDSKDTGVLAVTGGSYAVFADRLPDKLRAEAWAASYKAYSALWQAQAGLLEHFPLHIKGELLAGMAQSAQRTGHPAESAEFVSRIVNTMPKTPYASMAQKWMDNPETASRTKLTCMSCHEPGRLAARTSALASKDAK